MGNIPSLSDLAGPTSDDSIDRVSHLYSVLMLVVFGIAISSGQFFGDPIHCWYPAEFHDSYEEYTNNYCWIKNTYYVPITESLPELESVKEENEITYYQWIPLILLLQAMMFKVPNLVWRLLNDYSGISMEKIINLCNDTQGNAPEERQETIENLAKYLDKWLGTYQPYKTNIIVRMKNKISSLMCFICSKRGGTYLTGLYLFSKFLYFCNAVGQLFLLNSFMSQEFSLYGIEFIDRIAKGEALRESPRFPRITMCDFRIRQMNNLQPWTVQCVLPINLFNEKIFVFIWFWLVFISIISGLSFLRWVFHHLFKQDKVKFIKKYLKINKQLSSNFDKKLCAQFAMNYLRNDGVFVMYMIGRNSSEMVVCDLVLEMWKIFKAKQSRNNNFANHTEEPTEQPVDIEDEKKPLHDTAYAPQ